MKPCRHSQQKAECRCKEGGGVSDGVVRLLVVVLAALSMTTLSGCVGEWFAIRTVEEIQRSEYRAEYTSTKAPDNVTGCMMQTLYSHTNPKGARPYIWR